MGTTYEVLGNSEASLELHEMSDMFTVSISYAGNGPDSCILNITPAQLAQASVKLMRVASYYLDGETLREVVNEYIQKTGGYTAGIEL